MDNNSHAILIPQNLRNIEVNVSLLKMWYSIQHLTCGVKTFHQDGFFSILRKKYKYQDFYLSNF